MTASRPGRPLRRARFGAAAVLTVAGLPFVAPASPVEAQTGFGVDAVHVVVDVSGSMDEDDGTGKLRINGAKEAITAMVGGLPLDVPVGLRAYPDDDDCSTSGPIDASFFATRAELGSTVRGLSPRGNTPTADALRAAAKDLRSLGAAGRSVIVLISDGEANCNDDPCVVAAELSSTFGIDIVVNTIGFQISSSGRDQLECIADAGGGEYRNADDAEQLAASLQALAGAELAVSVDAPGTVIRSVGIGETAGRPPSVELAVTITNTSPNVAANVRATIVGTGDRRPFFLRPVRSLGNVEPGRAAPPVVWSFNAPLDFEDADVSVQITVSADNAPEVTVDRTIALRGRISLDDAGPLLMERSHVAILGDSYSSGEGTFDYIDGTDTDENPCHRSWSTYGKDLWPDEGARSVVACSGATTKHFWSAQHKAVPSQVAQLSSLHAERPVDLALLTIGGNDVGFSSLVIGCLLPGNCAADEAYTVAEVACTDRDAYPAPPEELTLAPRTGCLRRLASLKAHHEQLMTALVGDLVQVYRSVDSVLNEPTDTDPVPIVALAYPLPVPAGPRFDEVAGACGAWSGFSYDEWRYAVSFVTKLNATIATAVAVARDSGIPVYFADNSAEAFEPSHTICDDDRFVNSVEVSPGRLSELAAAFVVRNTWKIVRTLKRDVSRSTIESFHPNVNGYRAMTAALVEYSTSEAARAAPPKRTLIDVVWPPPAGPTIAMSGTTTSLRLPAGKTTTITLDGLEAGSGVVAHLASSIAFIGVGYADGDGNATLTVAIPQGTPPGEHTLYVDAVGVDGVALSYVVAATVAAPGSPWAGLSLVGATVLAGVAGIAAVVFIAARRRSARARGVTLKLTADREG